MANRPPCALALAAALAAASAALPTTPRGFTDDLGAALARSAANGHCVVAVFGASDWCASCERLVREVLSTDEFLSAATGRYELVFIDCPDDRGVIPDEAWRRNSALADRYDIDGFPSVLVLDSAGKPIASLDDVAGVPARYLEAIEEKAALAPYAVRYIKPLETILTRHDAAMQKEIEGVEREVDERFPEPGRMLGREERLARQRDMRRYAQSALHVRIVGKYIPLNEKALAEASAFPVPASLEKAKADLIARRRKRIDEMKAERAAYIQGDTHITREAGRAITD